MSSVSLLSAVAVVVKKIIARSTLFCVATSGKHRSVNTTSNLQFICNRIGFITKYYRYGKMFSVRHRLQALYVVFHRPKLTEQAEKTLYFRKFICTDAVLCDYRSTSIYCE